MLGVVSFEEFGCCLYTVFIMKALLSVLFFLLSCFPVLGEEFVHDGYDVHFEYGDSWVLGEIDKESPDEKFLVLKLGHSEGIASVNVWVYTYLNEKVVTINGFHLRRRTQSYDGWEHLLERPQSVHEIRRSGVGDGVVGVYSKRILNADLKKERWIVAEYYYVKENRGYVVSLKTRMDNWKGVRGEYKKMVESFWVGGGERPVPPPPRELNPNWEMVGGNGSNHRSSDSVFRLYDGLARRWEYQASSRRSTQVGAPLFVDDALYFSHGSHIEAVSVVDGSQLWAFQTLGPAKRAMAVQNGILTFVQGGDSAELIGLVAENGSKLFQASLMNAQLSDPVVYDGRIYLLDGTTLRVFYLDTGVEDWRAVLPVSEDTLSGLPLYPVMNGDVVVVSVGKDVFAFDQEDGDLLWRRSAKSAVLYSPILVGEQLIVSMYRKGRSGPVIEAWDLASGDGLWRHQGEKQGRFYSAPIFAEDQVFGVYSVSGAGVIEALDASEGRSKWVHSFPSYSGNLDVYPVVTPSRLFLLVPRVSDEEKSLSLLSLNSETGLPVSEVSLSELLSQDFPVLRRILAYRDGVYLQMGKQSVRHVYLK